LGVDRRHDPWGRHVVARARLPSYQDQPAPRGSRAWRSHVGSRRGATRSAFASSRPLRPARCRAPSSSHAPRPCRRR